MKKKVLKDFPGDPFKRYDYNSALGFLNCRICLAEKPEDRTPQEWNSLEAALMPLGGKNIVVLFCKRCGRMVWDTEGLDKLQNIDSAEDVHRMEEK